MMPGMDGFEVCRRLKGQVATAHLPIVLVTALDQPADRVRGLEAGADDFLTKPIDEIALIARVRSLARLKVTVDELRNRATTTVALGMIAPFASPNADDGKRGRIMIVDDRASSAERLAHALEPHHTVHVEPDAHEALFRAAEDNVDLIVVSLGLANFDGLRLCSQIRALERTRNLPILAIADLEDRQRVLRGLELGINDYLTRPVDRNELLARVRTQLRQKKPSSTSCAAGSPPAPHSASPRRSRRADRRRQRAAGAHPRRRRPPQLVRTDRQWSLRASRGHGRDRSRRRPCSRPPKQRRSRHHQSGRRPSSTDFCLARSDSRVLERTGSLPILLIADVEDRPRCCAAWNSARTTICLRLSTATSRRRACARNCGRSATPTRCARRCSNPSSSHSSIR